MKKTPEFPPSPAFPSQLPSTHEITSPSTPGTASTTDLEVSLPSPLYEKPQPGSDWLFTLDISDPTFTLSDQSMNSSQTSDVSPPSSIIHLLVTEESWQMQWLENQFYGFNVQKIEWSSQKQEENTDEENKENLGASEFGSSGEETEIGNGL